MNAPRHAEPSTHAAHDLVRIAALADRDATQALDPRDLLLARTQLEQCSACAALHRELQDLVVGVRMSAIPVRPRDFRLTAADADRTRTRGWRGWLSRIGSAGDAFSRPLAAGLTTLGLVAVLVGTVPGALPMGQGAASSDLTSELRSGTEPDAGGAANQPAPETEVAPSSGEALNNATDVPDAAASDDREVFSGAGEDGNDQGVIQAAPADEIAVRDDATGLSAFVVIGGTLLIVGLGLFALRWSARRLGDG